MAASETPRFGRTLMTLVRAIQRLSQSIPQPGPEKASGRPPRRPASGAPAPAPGPAPGPAERAGLAEQAWPPAFPVERVAPNLKPVHLHGHEPLIGLSAHTGIPAPVGQRVRRSIPQDVKIAVSARDGGRCRQCGSTHQLHFDHVIPVSRGGANTVANIQLLCGSCNRSKSARLKD